MQTLLHLRFSSLTLFRNQHCLTLRLEFTPHRLRTLLFGSIWQLNSQNQTGDFSVHRASSSKGGGGLANWCVNTDQAVTSQVCFWLLEESRPRSVP